MPKLYKVTHPNQGTPPHWYVTENEARLAGGDTATIEARDHDEVELRELATLWLNASEIKRAAARKREAAKTPERASAIANKGWETRRKNQK